MSTLPTRSSRSGRATSGVARSGSVEDIVEESVRTSEALQTNSPRISKTARRRLNLLCSTSRNAIYYFSTTTYYYYYYYYTSDTINNIPHNRATSHVVVLSRCVEDRGEWQ